MISDRRRHSDRGEDALIVAAATAARAGLDLIQIREPDLDARALTRLVGRCVEAVAHTHTRVLVNDRADVALAARAHGVHLRADSMPAYRLRAIAPVGFVIGRSVHTTEEAARVADEGGLDYLVYGTVFLTASKPGRAAAGPAGLAAVVQATSLPVLAVGGVTVDTARQLAATGASGFAAIGLFADTHPDKLPGIMEQAVRAFQGTR